ADGSRSKRRIGPAHTGPHRVAAPALSNRRPRPARPSSRDPRASTLPVRAPNPGPRGRHRRPPGRHGDRAGREHLPERGRGHHLRLRRGGRIPGPGQPRACADRTDRRGRAGAGLRESGRPRETVGTGVPRRIRLARSGEATATGNPAAVRNEGEALGEVVMFRPGPAPPEVDSVRVSNSRKRPRPARATGISSAPFVLGSYAFIRLNRALVSSKSNEAGSNSSPSHSFKSSC